VQAGDCYCPVCGLPQFVYTADDLAGSGQLERPAEAVRDAGSIDWKPALRLVLILAIPAGMLCSMLSPLGIFGLFLMAATSAWVVGLYMRSQRPAWLTIGAGARIGLVTGLVGGWTAAIFSGIPLYVMRFWLRQGDVIDNFWQNLVNQQMSQQWTTMGVDPQTIAITKAWMLSPEGRAGWILFFMVFLMVTLLLFSVGGGALGARLMGRPRRSAE
jgi:hypothetical protein